MRSVKDKKEYLLPDGTLDLYKINSEPIAVFETLLRKEDGTACAQLAKKVYGKRKSDRLDTIYHLKRESDFAHATTLNEQPVNVETNEET